GLSARQGALVTGIAVTDGPAAAAGLRAGDVILAFDGERVRGRRQLTRIIADAPIGAPIDVVINRDGTRLNLQVTLVTREQRVALGSAPAKSQEPGGMELSGLTLRNVSGDLVDRYNLPSDINGVVVTGVSHHLTGSVLQPGDVILELGWDQAGTVEKMSDHLNDLRKARSGPVKILVKRGDVLFYETLRP
ncbi:MAG: PDZ domain-containing protein, partial [Pseudomonadota bacterium]